MKLAAFIVNRRKNMDKERIKEVDDIYVSLSPNRIGSL